MLVAPFNDAERAVAIIEANAADLAAVIVEPLERVLRPEPGFLEAVREATARHGIVLIFDEVVTGFRIAWGGAQEALRRRAGPGDLRQGDERRLPDGRDRRTRRGHGGARRPAHARARTWPGPAAR